ncbi:MAG TPA: ROK family protein [Actinospica sp.]|jgi:glucokinase|nr:ROK family protein [Actinospica sp.]
MPHHVYGAVDIGGTKIAAGLVDADGGLLHRVELPTPARGPAEEVLATVVKLVDALAEDPRWARVAGVGIGSAGPVDPARGTVSPVNIPGWRDFPLVAHVAAHQAVAERELTVKLLGDASAMAAGEHWRGAARGYDDAMCLVVSTGVGAGLIVDGLLRTGPSGNAGHLGHITVDVAGEDCPCGSRGCVETMASGTSIARWAVQHGWRPGAPVPAPASAVAASTAVPATTVVAASVSTARSDVAAAHSDNVVVAARAITSAAAPVAATAADIAAAARAGDEIALAAFERAGRALAAGIAAAATLVDLRVAVVGGGVAKAGPVLFDPLRRHLARYASLPFTRDLEVLPATLGGDAGLIGAAAALTESHRERR